MNLEVPKDKDYFFELFGVPNERRSGVYTVELEHGKLWTKDDEGNNFIIYSNGESVEKMAVSFDLDQNAESLQYKKPSSPWLQKDGEYIEEECKFLPPPKTVKPPWLIFIKNDGSAEEFLNGKQLEYEFRVKSKGSYKCLKKQISKGQEKLTHL